jgi:hypothetical protein
MLKLNRVSTTFTNVWVHYILDFLNPYRNMYKSISKYFALMRDLLAAFFNVCFWQFLIGFIKQPLITIIIGFEVFYTGT